MQNVNHAKNIIKLHDVSYSYNGVEDAVKNVTLAIHEGDYLGIIGPNGGGKTTLLKIILGLLKPDSGTIQLSVPAIGYLAQNATHFDAGFPITVAEVVAQGRIAQRGLLHRLTDDDKQAIDTAIRQVGLEDFKNVLIGNLSGGQQQRVFIARAISGQQPHVIFLDEPTAGIDEESQTQFYSLLKKFNQEMGMTLVLIAHDLDVVMREVSHVAVINQKLIYYGDPKECPYV
jgi:zinc transport system ATP-binding protein